MSTSNSQHTPGPWLWEYDEAKRYGTVAASRSMDGELNGWISDGRYFRVSGAISEADTRLIAAAPELLEALEAIRNLRPDYTNPEEYRRMIWEAANKAIAKATTSDRPQG